MHVWGFPGGSVVKNLPANAGATEDMGSIPGSRRSPGEGNGNLLQYSSLENFMDSGAWQATVHGVAKNQTQEWLTHTQSLAKGKYNYHILIKKWRVVICMSYTTWKSKCLFHFPPSPTFICDLCAVTSWFGKEILTISLSRGGREVSPFFQPHCFHV